jgi:tRNA pseudouridine13 synthase
MVSLELDTSERVIGLEVFYTNTPGTGGKLKRQCDDFLVEEISRYPPRDDSGRYVVAKVTSENWETNRLIRVMSHALGISRYRIGFAGTKDKRAITSQLMSFEAPLESVQGISIHQVSITDAYRAKKNMTIGDLIGNRFRIKVRDCALEGEPLHSTVAKTISSLDELRGFPNFFGVQRFGSLRPITHIVGKHIIDGDFEKAVLAYAANPVPAENEEARHARKFIQETRDFSEGLKLLPRPLMFERIVVGHLAQHPGDFPGAIMAMPRNLQMMFVHAYQSYLFNRILSERIRRGLPLNEPLVGDVVLPVDKDGLPDHDKYIPVTKTNLDLVATQVRNGRAYVSAVLFGSDSELAKGEPGEIEAAVVAAERIERQDFVVPVIPECSSTGSRREIVARYSELAYSAKDRDLEIGLALGKGCYATTFLREIMKVDAIESDRAVYLESFQDAELPEPLD